MIKLTKFSCKYILITAIFFFHWQESLAQQKVILNEKEYIHIVPSEVIPNAGGTNIILSNIKFKNDTITLNYVNKGDSLFTLVWYLKLKDEMLVYYTDTIMNMTYHSSGIAKFGRFAFKETGKYKKGKITQVIVSKIDNYYDIKGKPATLFVFAVKGKVDPGKILPGDQTDIKTFSACSNVLSIKIKF